MMVFNSVLVVIMAWVTVFNSVLVVIMAWVKRGEAAAL